MKLIYEQTNIVKQILDKQKIDENKGYRKSFYLSQCPVEGGVLLVNTVTYELIFLTSDEIKQLKHPDLSNQDIRYLIESYFLVPEDFNDKKFASDLIEARLAIQNIYTNPPLSHFVILTTTGCNARCFYCFEQGAKISNMTENTAHDVADFIAKKGANKIRIQWFGGEPLVNMKVIDIISSDLAAKNIIFSSKMVTNGYLLDDEVIKKAVDLWKLDMMQITLDGTEEIYNKTKNYVYKNDPSPFKRVLNNIENALAAGIQVSVRLNMDEHNAEDLFQLSKLLVNRFKEYSNCHIYVVRLFEDTCSKIKNRDVADRHRLIENSVKLQNFIDENMPPVPIKNLPKAFASPNTCMACSDNSVMIVPDGHLGKCEHFVDSDFYGSIYSDEIDYAKIQKYKERRNIASVCEDCEMRSMCMSLKCCTGVPNHCDEADKMAIINRMNAKLRNIYNEFLRLEKEKNNF